MQYVDVVINGKPSRAMVDTRAVASIMTKSMTAKLRLSYSPSDTHLKMANAPPTLVCGVAYSGDHIGQMAR